MEEVGKEKEEGDELLPELDWKCRARERRK